MRSSRFAIGALLAATAVWLPSAAHAAGYKQYRSKVCPYSIRYPANWRIQVNRKSDLFVHRPAETRFSQVLISCVLRSKHWNIRQVTAYAVHRYRLEGYRVSKPKYKGKKIGVFFGQTAFVYKKRTYLADVEVTTLLARGKPWVTVLSADKTSFKGPAAPIYFRMLRSFRPR